jgi:hypothetical protein
MPLLQVQAALARVYFDLRTREALRRGDRKLADEFGLDPAEFENVRRVVVDQAAGVELFARTLARKRDERIHPYYPMVRAYLGTEKWQTLLAGYRERHPLPELRPAVDAVAFGQFLREATSAADDGVLLDLLMYEKTKAEVLDGPDSRQLVADAHVGTPDNVCPRLVPPARVRMFRHRISDLLDWVHRGASSPPNVPEIPTSVVFFRGAGDAGVCVSEVGLWLGSVLTRANGRMTLSDLTASLKDTAPDASVVDRLSEVLIELSRAGVVDLDPKGHHS